MKIEYEGKWDIENIELFREVLKKCNANLVYLERMLKRVNFDTQNKDLAQKGGWLRLRDEGEGRTSLTYKQNDKKLTIESIKEIEISVSDYETTKSLLKACGMYQKCEEETKRERWELDNVHIDIDTWPWLSPFIEIEGDTEKQVFEVAVKLGLSPKDVRYGPVTDKYMSVYDVNERSVVGHMDKYFSESCPWNFRAGVYLPKNNPDDISG